MDDIVAVEGQGVMTSAQLGQFVARARADLRLTQADLAHKIGMSASFIAQLEQGYKKRPTKQTLRKLAQALGLRYIDLLIAAGEIDPEDIEADPAFGDEDLRRVQALWRDLSDDTRSNIVVLAEGAARRSRRERAS